MAACACIPATGVPKVQTRQRPRYIVDPTMRFRHLADIVPLSLTVLVLFLPSFETDIFILVSIEDGK
jgi:hypothetical protein